MKKIIKSKLSRLPKLTTVEQSFGVEDDLLDIAVKAVNKRLPYLNRKWKCKFKAIFKVKVTLYDSQWVGILGKEFTIVKT